MIQFRKAIKVIDNCKDCPCHMRVWQSDQKSPESCLHKSVKNVYKRILEYYPETQMPTFDTNEGPPIAFSENDLKEIETDGFPYWCPLDRSK